MPQRNGKPATAAENGRAASHREEEEEEHHEALERDGGYGWVIVAAVFLIHVIVDGISFTFGVFSKSFKDYFETTESKVSLVGSLQAGVYLLVCECSSI